MTLSKSNIVVIVSAVIASVLASCHLLTLLLDTADASAAEALERPWLVKQLSAPWLLPAALILFTVIIVFMGVKCRKFPEFGGDRQSPVVGVATLLTSGVLGYSLVTGLISLTKAEPVVEVGANGEFIEQSASGDLPWKICFGIGICGAVALAVVAIGFFTGSNMLNRMPMLMLMPVLWLGMRLVLTFLELTSHASIAERSIELVMLVVMTLFMISLAKFLAGVGGASGKWASVYGGLTALYAFAAGISRVALSLYGGSDSGLVSQTRAEVIENYGLQVNYGDIAIGVFAVAMLVNISIRQREEEDEMAFGRKRRRNEQEMPAQRPMQQNQNMYQQPWPAQQPSMYQQQQMQQSMMRQQQMHQQNMMRQQQMQQQMQQNMYRQQMLQQQQMQQMQRNMYQQQMMQQNMMRQQSMNAMNPMNGMGAMNNMNNMNGVNGMNSYNADAQPVEAVQRQPEQRSARRPANRSTRMPDSFEVRTYGGPSINARKKFGGLDSFRDQMLSGQSALNMQSEELPPPPPPTVNMTEEEAAMQAVLAASLAAEDVNAEINDLTDQIQKSVEGVPEGRKGTPSTDVELEIPDDDAVISVLDDDEPADDHADERDYPAPPPTRTVTLGSGKHQGTLTDRLAELEEYKRRDARRQRPQERYEDEYDDYDEYADEYEEYEDDYDYEEYEDDYDDEYDDGYDDGYDDEYDEYDEYDDEYDEYEDEYDEYEEYDDDYYDEDDGYYEE